MAGGGSERTGHVQGALRGRCRADRMAGAGAARGRHRARSPVDELNLTDWFRTSRLRFTPVIIGIVEELRVASFAGRYDVCTNDASAPHPGAHEPGFALPSVVISEEPLGVQRGVNASWSHGGLAYASPKCRGHAPLSPAGARRLLTFPSRPG